MKRWYRSAPVKCALVIIEHILVMVMVMCIIWGAVYPGREYAKAFYSGLEKKYENTKGFTSMVENASIEMMNGIRFNRNFETDGKYNPDRLVDLKEYVEEGKISGENKYGIVYKLSDLVKMSRDISREVPNRIIVGQKADGSYLYYTFSNFKQQLVNGQLNIPDTEISGTGYQNYVLEGMENSYDNWEDNSDIIVTDRDSQVVFQDCWSIVSYVNESLKTDDGKTLMDIANENPAWNGKLSQMYDMLMSGAESADEGMMEYQAAKTSYTEGNTNMTYLLADLKAERIYTNQSSRSNFADLEKNIAELKKQGKYIIVSPKLSDFKTNAKVEAKEFKQLVEAHVDGIIDGDYMFVVSVDTSYPIQDEFYSNNQLYEKYAPWMTPIIISGMSAAVLFVILFIWITLIAGRTRQDGELKLNMFDRWKTEIWLAIMTAATVFTIMLGFSLAIEGFPGSSNMLIESSVCAVIAACILIIFITAYLGIVRRIKAKSLWSNSILKWLVVFIKDIFANRSCTFRSVAIFVGILLLQIFAAIGSVMTVVVIAADIWALIFILKSAMAKQKIKNGIERIAAGDVDYKIPLSGLSGENLDIAVRVNNIGEGLNAAVEANLKNERLKTDLITNVSHDIKTPLTSIINYVDLLKRENFTDTKVIGYLDILEAKAQRLKHLTEDVVEASKISSGNISLEFMNLNLVEMIHQTSGEFVEKFEKRSLNLVLNMSEEPAIIRADGRRMWRVLENVYNNAAKYAMEGTRIYADLAIKPRTIEFSLKNVSEQPLNISADELTERFIRGDVSRGTEGSGLGLSIAKNLTNLQGGRFELYLDGDLFKVTISFPKVYQKIQPRREEAAHNEKPAAGEAPKA